MLGRIREHSLLQVFRGQSRADLHGQNEIGTLQPLSDISAVAHERGALVHTDAAQTVGKVPVNVRDLGVDLLTVAGISSMLQKEQGRLYVCLGIELESLIHGRGRERGLRAGTENAAFAVARWDELSV
jgi:cysteine desulfurase